MNNLIDACDISDSYSCSSVLIYKTANYVYGQSGATISHGKTTGGDRKVHVEFINFDMPGITLRVRADNVRVELDALYAASEQWHHLDQPDAEVQSGLRAAFEALQAAVWTVAGRLVRVHHIEALVLQAYKRGLQDGKEALQLDLRALLGVTGSTW